MMRIQCSKEGDAYLGSLSPASCSPAIPALLKELVTWRDEGNWQWIAGKLPSAQFSRMPKLEERKISAKRNRKKEQKKGTKKRNKKS